MIDRRRFVGLAAAAVTAGLHAAPARADDVEADPEQIAARPSLRVLLGRGNAVATPGGGFVYDGVPYRGTFSQTPDGEIVNVVDVESYLYSVVPREMPPSWPVAALEAQAICARTYVLQRSDPRRDYDVVPSEIDQVYGGIPAESPAARSAVDATTSTVLQYGAGFAHIAYSSCCGGHTESASDAWGGAPLPYLSGVPCTYCIASPSYRWNATVPLDAIARACAGHVAPIGALRDVRLGSIDASGRAKTVTLLGEAESAPMEGSAFRIAVGARIVRSLRITGMGVGAAGVAGGDPAQAVDAVGIEGCGLGHGVGLCQWGARGLAQTGATVRAILAYYFPGTDVTNE